MSLIKSNAGKLLVAGALSVLPLYDSGVLAEEADHFEGIFYGLNIPLEFEVDKNHMRNYSAGLSALENSVEKHNPSEFDRLLKVLKNRFEYNSKYNGFDFNLKVRPTSTKSIEVRLNTKF